jgi:predicted molibdopterin-dependent oxidoreductase YjgC
MPGLYIDGQKVEVTDGTTILEAAEQLGIEIPTMCHIKGLKSEGACRMCLVEIEGMKDLQTACSTPCKDGYNVNTRSARVIEARRFILDLLLSNHNTDCFTCVKNGNCKLQDYCYEYGVTRTSYASLNTEAPMDLSNPYFTYDPQKCVLCRRCVRVCNELQQNHTITISERGFNTAVKIPFNKHFNNSNCVSCGNCVSACPTGALSVKHQAYRNWQTQRITTTCLGCGNGCQIQLLTRNGKIQGVEPASEFTDKGLLCVNGKFKYDFINSPDRLSEPLMRKNGKLQKASWDEVISVTASKLMGIAEAAGPNAIAGFMTARVTDEEKKAFLDLMRRTIGSKDVGICSAGDISRRTLDEILKDDRIRALYIVGDPQIEECPHVDFLIVQDIFLRGIGNFADVVLPACTFAEKDGTFTDTNLSVQTVRRAIPVLPGSRADLGIFEDIRKALGKS